LPPKRRRLSIAKGRKPERTAGSARGSRFRLRGTSKLRKWTAQMGEFNSPKKKNKKIRYLFFCKELALVHNNYFLRSLWQQWRGNFPLQWQQWLPHLNLRTQAQCIFLYFLQ